MFGVSVFVLEKPLLGRIVVFFLTVVYERYVSRGLFQNLLIAQLLADNIGCPLLFEKLRFPSDSFFVFAHHDCPSNTMKIAPVYNVDEFFHQIYFSSYTPILKNIVTTLEISRAKRDTFKSRLFQRALPMTPESLPLF